MSKNSSSGAALAVLGGLLVLGLLILLLPVALIGYGVKKYLTAARSDDPATVRTGRLAGAGLTACGLVLASVIYPNLGTESPAPAATGISTPASTARPEPPPAPDVTVPVLVGVRLDRAHNLLWNADLDFVEHDMSPLGRDPWADENWTVTATSPASGTRVPPGTRVTVWYLRTSEHDWFTRHTTMPRLPVGADTADVEDRQLAPVTDLIVYRWARGRAPDHARKPGLLDEPEGGVAPHVETAKERAARRGLKVSWGNDLVHGQWPRPRGRLRPGQLLLVTEREQVYHPGPSDGSYSVPDVYVDDDDDDGNVPGWLCPTRFC